MLSNSKKPINLKHLKEQITSHMRNLKKEDLRKLIAKDFEQENSQLIFQMLGEKDFK